MTDFQDIFLQSKVVIPPGIMRKALAGLSNKLTGDDRGLRVGSVDVVGLVVAWLALTCKGPVKLDPRLQKYLESRVNLGGGELSRYQVFVWKLRCDLVNEFDLSFQDGVSDYKNWWVRHGSIEVQPFKEEVFNSENLVVKESTSSLPKIPYRIYCAYLEAHFIEALSEDDYVNQTDRAKALSVMLWLVNSSERLSLPQSYVDFFNSEVSEEALRGTGLTNLEYYYYLSQRGLRETFDLTKVSGLGAYFAWLSFHGETALPDIDEQVLVMQEVSCTDESDLSPCHQPLPALPYSVYTRYSETHFIEALSEEDYLNMTDDAKALSVMLWLVNSNDQLSLPAAYVDFFNCEVSKGVIPNSGLTNLEYFYYLSQKNLRQEFDLTGLRGIGAYHQWLSFHGETALPDIDEQVLVMQEVSCTDESDLSPCHQPLPALPYSVYTRYSETHFIEALSEEDYLNMTDDAKALSVMLWLVNSNDQLSLPAAYVDFFNCEVSKGVIPGSGLTNLEYFYYLSQKNLRQEFDLTGLRGIGAYHQWLSFHGETALPDIDEQVLVMQEVSCTDESDLSPCRQPLPALPYSVYTRYSETHFIEALSEEDYLNMTDDAKALSVMLWLVNSNDQLSLPAAYVDFFNCEVSKGVIPGSGLTNLEYFYYLSQKNLRQEFDLTGLRGICAYLQWFSMHGKKHLPVLERIRPLNSDHFISDHIRLPELPKTLKAAAICGVQPLGFELDLERNDHKGLVVTWSAMNVARALDLNKDYFEYLLGACEEFGEVWIGFRRIEYFMWVLRKDLQKEFNTNTTRGRIEYSKWLRNHFSTVDVALELMSTKPSSTERNLNPLGVNIIGMANAELGIGEDVRMLAMSLDAEGINYCIYNYPEQTYSRKNDHQFSHKIVKQLEYKVNIFCLPAIEVIRAYFQLGQVYFDGHYNIGYWPWELPYWPREFEEAFQYTDEVWCSSKFIAESVRPATNLPVHIMPMAVVVDEQVKGDRRLFDIGEDDFSFLYIFDSLSFPERKNPLAAIRAFKKAFSGREKCKLIIKTMHLGRVSEVIRSEIFRAIDGDERVCIIDSVFNKDKLYQLYRSVDAYVSLHRSEGFGRTISEAMLFDLPVIVSNYSGNVDFCERDGTYLVEGELIPVMGNYQYSDERQVWFDADVDSAAKAMFSCYSNSKERESKAQVSKNVSHRFSPDSVSVRYGLRLQEIFERLVEKDQGVDLLAIHNSVDIEFFQSPLEPALKLMNRRENIQHYRFLLSQDKYYPRKLIPGFHPLDYSSKNEIGNIDPTAHFLLQNSPNGSWLRPLVDVCQAKRGGKSSLTVALHIHAYYQDQLPGIFDRLSRNQSSPDIFISYSGEWTLGNLIGDYLDARKCRVTLREVPNRGRDLGPMLTTFANDILDYDLIGHIHTKKTKSLGDDSMAEYWSAFLYENLIGGRYNMMDAIIESFDIDCNLGIVFPDDPNICDWGQNKKIAEELLADLECQPAPDHIFFPVGSMFWGRVEALRAIFKRGFLYNDYPDEPIPDDGTLLHAIERVLALIAESRGFTSSLTHVEGVTR